MQTMIKTVTKEDLRAELEAAIASGVKITKVSASTKQVKTWGYKSGYRGRKSVTLTDSGIATKSGSA